MLAKEIMREKVITVSPHMTIRELAQMLIEKRISGAPVVDEMGRLLGVVSKTDLVRREREESPEPIPNYHTDADEPLRAHGFHMESPDYTRVKDVMTPGAISFEENTPMEKLAQQMLRKDIHRVLITRKGVLCGIVTTMDLLRGFLRMKEKVAL